RARGLDETFEVAKRPEARLDGLVSAVGGSDRPRTSWIARLRGQRVIAPFSKTPADRMNRRQIQHVEVHGRDIRQAAFGFLERGAARRVGSGRAREHLVPRAESRTLALDDHAQVARIARPEAPAAVFRQRLLFEPLARDVLAGGDLFLDAVAQARDAIDPGLDGEFVI